MAETAETYVGVEIEDGVAVLTMTRPPVNAMSESLAGEVGACLARVQADPSVRVLVIASGLTRVFCGGADIDELRVMDAAGSEAFIERGRRLVEGIQAMPLPVIAAVGGAAVGGGCELAMTCDLRVAGASARFGQPEVNLGIIPTWGGTQMLPRLVGATRAAELLMLGDPIQAQEALSLGLVNRVVADGEVLSTAVDLARTLAGKSATALAAIKGALWEGLPLAPAQGLEAETRRFHDAFPSGDAEEGIAAFLEKRPPRFGPRQPKG